MPYFWLMSAVRFRCRPTFPVAKTTPTMADRVTGPLGSGVTKVGVIRYGMFGVTLFVASKSDDPF